MKPSNLSWPVILRHIATNLGGSTSSALGYVLELTTPVVSGWFKGQDSKKLPTSPSPAYASILIQLARLHPEDLKRIFERASKLPRALDLKAKAAHSNRQVDPVQLVTQQTSLAYLINESFKCTPKLSLEDLLEL